MTALVLLPARPVRFFAGAGPSVHHIGGDVDYYGFSVASDSLTRVGLGVLGGLDVEVSRTVAFFLAARYDWVSLETDGPRQRRPAADLRRLPAAAVAAGGRPRPAAVVTTGLVVGKFLPLVEEIVSRPALEEPACSRCRPGRFQRPSSRSNASTSRAAAGGPTELTSPYWSSERP